MPAAIVKARKCWIPPSPSDWVHMIALTCDDQLVVWFKSGQRVKKILDSPPGAYLAYEPGVPAFCCYYPALKGAPARNLYEISLVYQFAGEWVHRFLYKKFPYLPCTLQMPCGACTLSCSLTSATNPSAEGNGVLFTVTVTNDDGDAATGSAPQGTVEFTVDGVTSCNRVDLDPHPTILNTATATCTHVFNTAGTYVVQAIVTPSGGFSATACQTSQTVTGVTSACCPGIQIPSTLYLTGLGASSIALIWDGTTYWQGNGTAGCGDLMIARLSCGPPNSACSDLQLEIQCNGGTWDLASNTACTCDPLSLSFSFTALVGNGCTGCNGQTFNMTVTP